MRRVILCIVVLMMLPSIKSSAENPAGAVLYLESGGEVYLLLAEHARGERGWAGFGGGPRDGETIAETAAHKVEEESRGYFNREGVLKKIEGQSPIYDGDFGFYFVQVPFIPAQRVMNNPVPEDTDSFKERSTYAWIPFSAVESYLKDDIDREKKYEIDPAFLPAGSRTNWFWIAWLRNMRKATTEKAFPWDKE